MVETTSSKLRRLRVTAAELREIKVFPGWFIEDYLNILDDLITLADGIDDVSNQVANVTRITAADSPYNIQTDDGTIFCDTTSGDIRVILPPGTQSETHRVVNTGLAGNDVTLEASVGEEINGSVDSETLFDGESWELQYDENDGWF